VGLSLQGSIPVLSLNLGASLALVGLQADVARLQNLVSQFAEGTLASAELKAGVGVSPADILAGMTAWASLDIMGPTLDIGASFTADASIELGLVNAEIAIVEQIQAAIAASLGVGGIAAWTYAGNAHGFGSTLADSIKNDWSEPSDNITYALIAATEDPTAWKSIKQLWDTGAAAYITSATDKEDLRYRGELKGAQLNLGAQIYDFADLLAQLYGLRASLEAQADAYLGIGLPSISADFDLSIDVEAVVAAFADFSLDIELPDLNFTLGLIAQYSALIGSADVWLWKGKKGALGTDFNAAISNGLPNGSGPNSAIYGIVLAAASPEAWVAFSTAGYAAAALQV